MSARTIPGASSEAVRARMQRQRRRDTGAEMAIRRLVHAEGLRYRVDTSPLPGMRCRADMVFPRQKLAVFVDGCFWHGCPEHATSPKANAEWWRQKITANQARDRRTDGELAAAGWQVLRIWEHEDPLLAAGAIVRAVRETTLR